MTRPLLLAALLLAACNTDVDPQFRVRDVRILAVRAQASSATPPAFPAADVAPGDTLVLEALVANPLDRPGLTVEWFVCLPRPDEAVSPCADLAALEDPDRIRGLPGVTALPPGPSTTLVVPPLPEALAFVVQAAVARPVFACRMYAELGVVAVASAGGRRSVAVKTVRVKPPVSSFPPGLPDLYPLNHRPAVAGLFRGPAGDEGCAGGISLAAAPLPAGTSTLCGTSVTGSVERFNVCDPSGDYALVEARDEALTWQWYVSDGDFPDVGGVGNARGDRVDFVRPAGAFTLWAILRDGRGGDDWVTLLVSAN